MQFRKRIAKSGEIKIQIIRWAYDAAKERTLPTCLGTVSSTMPNPPKVILEKCSGEEREEIEAFWKVNRVAAANLKLIRTIKRMDELARDINEGFERGLIKEPEISAIRRLGEKLATLGQSRQLDLVEHIQKMAA